LFTQTFMFMPGCDLETFHTSCLYWENLAHLAYWEHLAHLCVLGTIGKLVCTGNTWYTCLYWEHLTHLSVLGTLGTLVCTGNTWHTCL